MPVDTPAFIDSALSVYHAEVHRAIRLQEERLGQLQAAQQQLEQTMSSVQQLPGKLRHQVMVPFGSHAFFPGQLTRTNELLVHLGDQYYVEATAAQAHAILARKAAVLAAGVDKARTQLTALRARLEVTGSSFGSDAAGDGQGVEIRSSVEESDALLASAAAAARKRRAGAAAASSSSSSSTTQQRPRAAEQAAAKADPEFLALQARLDELIQLEEQQEAEEQQQQRQQTGLQTVAEEEEEEEEQQPAPAAAGAGLLGAAAHIRQLEAEPDSDDDEQQQQHASIRLQPSQPPVARAGHSQQQLQQPGPGSKVQLQQQSVAATRGGAALKPALKRGFLTQPGSSTSSSSRVTPGKTPAAAAAGAKPLHSSSSRSSTAFTGAVVERSSPAVALAVELPAAGPLGGASTPSSSANQSAKLSKFKLRRMGLDEPPEA